MAINPHDDYEKLAKLLYPSIEASGNVYYGQTRKLTMDEVLNKNDLGFESHPEYYSNSKTCSFCWKLGPLHGKIIFNTDVYNTSYVTDNTFSNYTVEFNDTIDNNINVYYAKYLINKESSSIVNTTHSAEYNTYENNISLELQSILACTSKLYEDKNFFIENSQYLYVLILTDAPYVGNGSNNEDESIDNFDEANMPLTIKNVGSSIMQVSVYLVVADDEESTTTQLSDLRISDYKYKTNNDADFNNLNGWSIITDDGNVPIVIGAESAKIELNPGESVQFVCTNFAGNYPGGGWLYNHKTYHTLRITGNNAAAEAYGNILSMLGEDFSTITYVVQYALYRLFLDCTSLIRAPYIPPANYYDRAIQRTFMGCTSLKQTPNLHLLSNSNSNALVFTFFGCTSLVTVNDILVDSSTVDLSSTFYGCNSVSKVISIKTANNGKIKLVNTQDTPPRDAPLPWTFFGNSNSSLTSLVLNVSPDEIILDSSSINWLPSNNGIVYLNPKYILDNMWDSLILENWLRKPILTYRFNYIDNNYPKEVISYGSNNNQNGRGNIYDVSTINNFEKSFDENGTHQMNSYNQDGSYNQEIWGYKSFNSPVQFRNGIYGENAVLSASNEDNIYCSKFTTTAEINADYNTKQKTEVKNLYSNSSSLISDGNFIGTLLNTNCDANTFVKNSNSQYITYPETTGSYVGTMYIYKNVTGKNEIAYSELSSATATDETFYGEKVKHYAGIRTTSSYSPVSRYGNSSLAATCNVLSSDQEHLFSSSAAIKLNTIIDETVLPYSSDGVGEPSITILAERAFQNRSAKLNINVNSIKNKSYISANADEIELTGAIRISNTNKDSYADYVPTPGTSSNTFGYRINIGDILFVAIQYSNVNDMVAVYPGDVILYDENKINEYSPSDPQFKRLGGEGYGRVSPRFQQINSNYCLVTLSGINVSSVTSSSGSMVLTISNIHLYYGGTPSQCTLKILDYANDDSNTGYLFTHVQVMPYTWFNNITSN